MNTFRALYSKYNVLHHICKSTDVFMWPCSALHRNSDKGVEIAFLGTRTGLSRTNLFVPADQLSNRWVPPLNISVIITYSSRCRCDCAWWIWSFTRHVSFIVCASSETSWQRRTRRVCLMLITSLCGTRERQSRSPAHLSTPSPSAQVCRTKKHIQDMAASVQYGKKVPWACTKLLIYCC